MFKAEVKTGMLPNKEQIAALAGEIEKHEKTVQADVLSKISNISEFVANFQRTRSRLHRNQILRK